MVVSSTQPKKESKCPFGLFSSKGVVKEKTSTKTEQEDGENRINVRNRFLPLETSINMLKHATGKDDIQVGNIRKTLFDVFGDDASPKVKKFMKVILSNLHESIGEGLMLGQIGKLATNFLTGKLNDEEFLRPRWREKSGTRKRSMQGQERGLLSGCQTDQFSADVGSKEKAFGAFTNSLHRQRVRSVTKIWF